MRTRNKPSLLTYTTSHSILPKLCKRSVLTRASSSESFQKRLCINTPKVTSKRWCIYEGKSGKKIHGVKEKDKVQIASLTKIMTFKVALRLTRRFNLNLNTQVFVEPDAVNIVGTKAKLRPGDSIKLWDLFHALMLPSGNDAALVIADFFGSRLGSSRASFIEEMNRSAKMMGLEDTSYGNPHGLISNGNISSARDVCILASICLKDPLFQQVVNTAEYTCTIIGEEGESRLQKWKNTNMALALGFSGVKTGITTHAGPCLCASKEVRDGQVLVITILNCRSKDSRWQEVNVLAEWAAKRL